jgi:hypothetical protein
VPVRGWAGVSEGRDPEGRGGAGRGRLSARPAAPSNVCHEDRLPRASAAVLDAASKPQSLAGLPRARRPLPPGPRRSRRSRTRSAPRSRGWLTATPRSQLRRRGTRGFRPPSELLPIRFAWKWGDGGPALTTPKCGQAQLSVVLYTCSGTRTASCPSARADRARRGRRHLGAGVRGGRRAAAESAGAPPARAVTSA